MNVKLKVTFDMDISAEGECKTLVSFTLVDYPEIPCPEDVKKLVIGQIHMLCGAMSAVSKEVFSENAPDQRPAGSVRSNRIVGLLPEIEKVLRKEQSWHEKKRGNSGKGADWEQGFIEGIQYSRLLIPRIKKQSNKE